MIQPRRTQRYTKETSVSFTNELNHRFRIPDWLLLLAFCGFFFFWRLAAFGLIGADEPRYAQVAREMLERHDWTTPTLGGAAWLEKPPLYYWQAMVVFRLFGVSDWAARLPSSIDALLMVFAVFGFLRRFRPGFELDGALMMTAAAGIVGFARAASMDITLAAMFTLSMLAWWAWFETGSQKYLAAYYAFVALATLAKGPVAPFLAAVIVLIFAVTQQSLQIAWKTLWTPGILLFLLMALPWYVLAQIRNPQFFKVFIVEHNLARFGSNVFHHPEPFWYYAPVTLLGWAPWSVFACVALVSAVRRFKTQNQDTLDVFFAIWVAVIVVFFSISQSKLPGYILPTIPAGVLLLSEYVRERLTQKLNVVLAAAHSVLAAVLVFYALDIQYLVLRHRVSWGASIVPLTIASALCVFSFFLLHKYGNGALRVATLVPAVVTLAAALRLGGPALDASLSARGVVNGLSQFDPRHIPVAVFLVPRETEFGITFYRDETPYRYESGEVPDGEHLVVVGKKYSRGVAKAAGRRATYLGEFAPQGLDYFYVPPR
jgi:4-amino-4-deoxy-L-arabinose transferase-like glycosyltransferase